MAYAGPMPPIRIEEAVPGISKCLDYSVNLSCVFPYCESCTTNSDITRKDPTHWETHSTAALGFTRFDRIIEQLENLRVTANLLQEINRTDAKMLSKNRLDINETSTLAESFSYSTSGDSDINYDPKCSASKQPHFKESHRIRRREDGNGGDSSGQRVRRYSPSFERPLVETNQEQEQARTDTDVIEGGPIRQLYHSVRHQPYSVTEERLSRSPRSNETHSPTEQILLDKEYNQRLSPCVDRIESASGRTLPMSETTWDSNNTRRVKSLEHEASLRRDVVSLPSIVIDDPVEEPLFELLFQEGYQSNQVFPEAGNACCSPGTRKTWSDSSMDNYNLVTSQSGCSSPAQSPGSATNLESTMMLPPPTYSPVGSPQLGLPLKVPQGLSSSESSNQSYADTPSPLSYHTPISSRVETQLGIELQSLFLWNDPYESAETPAESTSNTIDNNELQFVEEILRDMGKNSENTAPQVVPVKPQGTCDTFYPDDAKLTAMGSEASTSNLLSVPFYSSENFWDSSYTENANPQHGLQYPTDASSNVSYSYEEPCAGSTRRLENFHPMTAPSSNSSTGIPLFHTSSVSCPSSAIPIVGRRQPAEGNSFGKQNLEVADVLQGNGPDEFEIPPMVASFESTESRRTSRTMLPWPLLNLPLVRASERLKDGLDPKEVKKAMRNLLKRRVEELAKPDRDGDTMLMCLVGNPEEFLKKKAYLAPLVETLSNAKDALTMTNNRGEDAIYLAAMNCPGMPYVAGYLAATMLQKGIDISQRLYHTRGDTLIHAVSGRGDSHGEVLAELLALRTSQGYSIFDLSKRNYDGRTALHVAVESHGREAPGNAVVSSVRTVQLLLENGADPKIKETKCGDTALHIAVSLSCDPVLVKILLKKCTIDVVNATNYSQKTALQLAASASSRISLEKQREVCQLLINAGGRRSVRN